MRQSNNLLANKTLRDEMGRNAQQFAKKQHGATEKTIDLLTPLLERAAS